jgi:hypothetical protein
MSTAKDLMAKIINEQPDDSSFDEILRELAFVRMIARGLEDVQAGRVISDADLDERIRSLRQSSAA